ncbi:Serine acetyltransferase [compost metagenome]
MLREVPDNSTVVGNPGRIVKRNGERVKDRLDHTKLPDPVIDSLRFLQKEIEELREQLGGDEQKAEQRRLESKQYFGDYEI